MKAVLFIIGLISILGQVVLLRELNVASFGVELVYILALGFWLAATALGALFCRSTRAPRPGLLTIPLLLFAALLPLAVAFARASRFLAGGVPGAYLPFGEQIITIGITLLPAGFITGWLFRRAAGFFVSEGRTVAAAYAIESAGGIAGGLLSSLGLHWGVQNFALALIGALIAAAAPLLITAGAKHSRSTLPAIALCGIFLLCIYQAPALDGMMTRWNHPSLLQSKDSPYGRISITQREEQLSVFLNDALAFETEGTEAEHFAHLAALQHPQPERILILGGGIEGTVAEVLKHGPAAIDYVEVDPVLIGTVRNHLSPQRQEPLGKPGVRIITDDPRRFLQAADGRYDLILIGMPEPSSGQTNRFFTLEFFQLCRDRLKPDGIVAMRLQAAENRWTPQMTERALSIHGALFSVFGNVLIIPGDTDVVTASLVSLPSDPEVLIERLRSRGIRSRLISEPFIRYLLTNDRFSEVEQTVRTHTAPLNTDTRPICYQLTALLWLSKFYPALTGLSFGEIESLIKEKRTWIAAAAGLLLILFFIARSRPSWRRTLLVGVAGFAGMVLETVLILQYQTRHGVLYRDLGILITAFMLGLTAGALVVAAAARGKSRYRTIGRQWGVGFMAGFMLLGTLAFFQARIGRFAELAETAGLLAAAGFLVAGVFAYASLRGAPDQEKAISPLYAADLFGGCLGSVAASLFMVPLIGMDMTAAGMVILSLVAVLLI
jgi:spermidine synthase